MMQKQNGFTLIELVVVIIILGILAVTAAPKFINLQSDARKSTLEGMKGALKGANSLLYSKAAIQGKEKADGDETANIDTTGNGTADTIGIYGYVKASSTEMKNILEIDDSEWTITDPAEAVSKADIIIHPADITPSKDIQCFVEYSEATDTTLPVYKVVDTNC